MAATPSDFVVIDVPFLSGAGRAVRGAPGCRTLVVAVDRRSPGAWEALQAGVRAQAELAAGKGEAGARLSSFVYEDEDGDRIICKSAA